MHNDLYTFKPDRPSKLCPVFCILTLAPSTYNRDHNVSLHRIAVRGQGGQSSRRVCDRETILTTCHCVAQRGLERILLGSANRRYLALISLSFLALEKGAAPIGWASIGSMPTCMGAMIAIVVQLSCSYPLADVGSRGPSS